MKNISNIICHLSSKNDMVFKKIYDMKIIKIFYNNI